MDIQISYVSINRRGQEQRDQRRIEGPLINVGRGSQCQLHLPDPRIALQHAHITVSESGAVLESDPGRMVINGRASDSTRLAVGDRIELGPYLLEVEAPPQGVALALVVSLVVPLSSFGGGRRFELRAPRLSKRRLSYVAFFGALLLCLLIPLSQDLLGYPAKPPVAVKGKGPPVDMQEHVVRNVSAKLLPTLNPGPVSRAHQNFGDDCRACHEQPFIQVQDRACIACHKSIKEHVPVADLTGLKGHAFRDTRCAECHRDHKGIQMAPRSQEQCADCHRDVTAVAAKAKSGKVTDFADGHPEFRLTLLDANKPDAAPNRVRMTTPPSKEMVERSNLKFDHKLHMDPAGVRDPNGRMDPAGMRDAQGRPTVLKCSTCHQIAEGGRLIAPISMEKNCQSCHSLAFEPKITSRQVVHGDEAQIATMLREFYARLVLGDVPPDVSPPLDLPRMRPGAELAFPERLQAMQIADQKANMVLRELFDTRKVCVTCHEVSKTTGSVGWRVAPVRIAKIWMPQALFSHAKHKSEDCTKCHDITKSTSSSTIAMPSVKVCQECHTGASFIVGKVTSDCGMCHKFHAGRDYWHAELQAQMLPGGKK
jgi:predicted CXXCH cytochrome family protein